MLADYHTHTNFSDGDNTPEEMVQAALKQGLEEIGISDHSYTFFDESYCLPRDRQADYVAEITRLKIKYLGQINVFCGIEQDFEAEPPEGVFDYVIGSVHYVKKQVGSLTVYIPVDESPELMREAVDKLYEGDFYSFAEDYYRSVSRLAERTACDIIGHFDLVAKFNEKEHFFDEQEPRYVKAWQAAADELLKSGKPFEINTGAEHRGWRTVPYPAPEIREYIQARGGSFIWASDAHNEKNICFGFPENKE